MDNNKRRYNPWKVQMVLILVMGILIGIVTYFVSKSLDRNLASDNTNDTIAYGTSDTSDPTTINLNLTNALQTYSLDLVETPEESMWEFTTGVDRIGSITIGHIYREQSPYGYNINMYREQSLISDEYLYYLEILMGSSAYVYRDSILLRVTEDNIDAYWAAIQDGLDDYNNCVERENAGEIEYDSETWESVFDKIETHIEQYESGLTATDSGDENCTS